MRMTEPDKKIRELAEKWLKGTITTEEEQAFADWYNSGQESPLYIPGSYAPDEETLRQRILEYINHARDQKPLVKRIKRKDLLISVAAVFLVLLMGSFLWRNMNTSPRSQSVTLKTIFAGQDRLIKKINPTAHTMLIVLTDGSTVQLGGKSRVVYSNNYGRKDRTLFLEGDAVFNVKHNASLPFEVHAFQLITKVLGTKFKINTENDGRKVTIAVLDGKVSVSRETPPASPLKGNERIKENTGFVLVPNQQIVFDPSSKEMQKSLVPLPVAIDSANSVDSTEKRNLAFEATPLAQVFYQVGKIYGISIVFDNTALQHCSLTADLNKGSFYDKLDKICLATNLHYNEMDGHIVISGKGCN